MSKNPLELPTGFYWDESFKLGNESSLLTAKVWPNYLVSESDIPEPGFKFEISEQEFIRRFPVWGIRHADTNQLAAFINAVQLFTDLSAKKLPEKGWSFAIPAAGAKETPNCLCLLVANVAPTDRGFGLSKILIEKSKLEAKALGFNTLIAPVRPTLKHEFSDLSMDEYLAKRSENGEIFDPWIHQHVKMGGEVLNICHESVKITASLEKWREWTALNLAKNGEHLLPGGLVPLQVDLEKNIGVYCEPNVWIRYSV